MLGSNWWYSFKEINILKSVNKHCFDQKNKKWTNLVYLVYFFTFLTFSKDFKIWKNFKANFPL